MSEELKQQLASKLGVGPTVASEGWGSVSSRDCGRLVQAALEVAEQNLQQRTPQRY
ncbi:MAG: small, acid-soluble spore protein, alpha/beta type [Thermaerobacter sp.]|nr:small, acid-soluble spore protein, alpha/beta type [Thermaerobacter sp.]